VADIDFRTLGNNLVEAVRSRFKKFLEEHPDVDDFVLQIGQRYAARTAAYHLAATEEDRAEQLAALRRVENTMQLELDAIAHEAAPEILEQLKAALGVVLNFAIQNLPTIVAMIRR